MLMACGFIEPVPPLALKMTRSFPPAVVTFASSEMVMVPAAPSAPAPIPGAFDPLVAFTVPPEMVMVPPPALAPPPIPAEEAPPVAFTVPPEMVMVPAFTSLYIPVPLPIPAALFPPTAVTVPPEMVMVPPLPSLPPPIPAALCPPVTFMVPPLISTVPQLSLLSPPIPAFPASVSAMIRVLVPVIVRLLPSETLIPFGTVRVLPAGRLIVTEPFTTRRSVTVTSEMNEYSVPSLSCVVEDWMMDEVSIHCAKRVMSESSETDAPSA